jgi:hypothetical protein
MTEETWKGIKEKRILPHILAKEDYQISIAKGLGAATTLLSKLPTIRPNPNLLRLIHAIIFQNTTPWAGQFVTANPHKTTSEINKTRKNWEKIKNRCPPEECARHLAWLTASLLRIAPFKDGNEHTILCLILALSTRELSKTPDTNLIQNRLRSTIPETRKGNLQPLGELLLAACGLETTKT